MEKYIGEGAKLPSSNVSAPVSEEQQYFQIQIEATNFIYRNPKHDNKISIVGSVFNDIKRDMLRRNYETAGFLVGNMDENGKVVFSAYVPQKGIRRHRWGVKFNITSLEKQLAELKENYNAIAFVHLHPYGPNYISRRIPDKEIGEYLYFMNAHLNHADKKTAIELEYPLALKAGFEEVFAGVLIKAINNNGIPTAILTLYNCKNGADIIDDFGIEESRSPGEDNRKEVLTRLLRRAGQEIKYTGQDIKYSLGETLRTQRTVINYPIEDYNRCISAYKNLNKFYQRYIKIEETATEGNPTVSIVQTSTLLTRILRLDGHITEAEMNMTVDILLSQSK